MSNYGNGESQGFDGSSFEDQLAALDSYGDQQSAGRDQSAGGEGTEPREQAYPQGQWEAPSYPPHNPPPPPYAQEPGPYPPPPAYPVPGYPQEPPAFGAPGYSPVEEALQGSPGPQPPTQGQPAADAPPYDAFPQEHKEQQEPQSQQGEQDPQAAQRSRGYAFPGAVQGSYGPPPQPFADEVQPGPPYARPPQGYDQPPPYDQPSWSHEQPPSYDTYRDIEYDQRYDEPQQGRYAAPPEAYAGPEDPYTLPYDPYAAAMGPGMGTAAPPGPPQQGPPQYQPGPPQYQPGPPQYQPGPPQQAPPQYAQPQVPPAPETAESLNSETLLRGRRRPPSAGWRRAVYKASGGLIHPGESPAELRHRKLVARVRTPVAQGHHRVAVLSLKGGVGKTTSTIGLGSTLASLRGDRIIAVDANPDRGTLSDKVRPETAATVRDLLNERGQVQRYADVRAFTSQSPSRLEVLASDPNPAVSEAFSEDDYRAVANVLEHFYSICITDCGTGLLHSAMTGVLGMADQVVLVSSPSVDGARSASATLDWLEAHEYGRLVRSAVVVLSTVRPKSKSTVDIDRLHQHFANRCRDVVRIPYDPHLEEGAEVDLERLTVATRDAYLSMAASVGDGFGRGE